MKVYAEKKCDICGRTVATKYFLRYNTVMDYVTVRGDEVPTYGNYEDSTTRVDKHYCYSCWSRIVRVATETQKIVRDMDTSSKRALGYEED